MFEKFTAEARKAVFFARYEASTFGTNEIETEHLLLGILRADRNLARRLFPSGRAEENVRARIERDVPVREKTSASVDIPVSFSSKRALAFAAEESVQCGDSNIDTEHLLLGIAREESCLAAVILREAGVTLALLRQLAASGSAPQRAAETGDPAPLIGRETELGRATQILSRRTKNSVALIGEAGVGKTAIVEGLAHRLAGGAIPGLGELRILSVDAITLFPPHSGSESRQRTDELLKASAKPANTLLCIEGLFDLAAMLLNHCAIEAAGILGPFLAQGTIRCIATGTAEGLRRTVEHAPALARHFEVIGVAAPDPSESIVVLNGLKSRYEQFHGVTFSQATIEMAVYASGRFLAHRSLPDRALDLLDEAGARVRLRRETEPPDVVEARKRARQHARNLEEAIAGHNHSAAREHADAERAERENLRRLLEESKSRSMEPPGSAVTPEDIEQVVADRAGVPVSVVRTILRQKGPGELRQVVGELSKAISIDANGWVAALAAYIARSSGQEVDALVEAIRAARSCIDY